MAHEPSQNPPNPEEDYLQPEATPVSTPPPPNRTPWLTRFASGISDQTINNARTALIVVPLLFIVGFVGWWWVNRDTVGQPDPILAKYQAWGDACQANLDGCSGDRILYADGSTWVVSGNTAEDRRNRNRVVSNRFAGVAGLITLEECPQSPYCDALFEYYERTRQQAEAQETVPEAGLSTALPPETEVVPVPPAETSETTAP